MSEASAAQEAAMAGTGESSFAPSAGTLLRQAREAAGLHIGALSVALKVPVKKLEALEADQHTLLPDAVFARALAASVCRTLKIDPEPVLNRLPAQVMPRLELDSRTSDRANLHTPRALWHAPLPSRLPRPVALAAAALVVGALALYAMPSLTPMLLMSASNDSVPAAVGAIPPPAPVPNIAMQAAPAQAPATEPVSAEGAVAPPPVVVPALAATPAVLPSEVPSAATAAGPPLLFKAKGASWVEVTDSAGVPLLRKILNAGDVVPVSGPLPLSVVVGRADAIDVLVRGQAFDLAGLSRDNVARFQIK